MPALAARYQRELLKMCPKSVLIALLAFLSFSEFANAGVMLFVHFGADPIVYDENHLVQSYTPDGETQLTASYFLQITGDSTIYAYRFSVKFNDNLTFASVTQTRPGSYVSQRHNPLVPEDLPAPDNDHGVLKRFSGIDPNVYDDDADPETLGAGMYKLATTVFNINGTLNAGDQLVQPGQYDAFFNSNDLGFFDSFSSQVDDDYMDFFPDVSGGSVSLSSVVPEPNSALILGLFALVPLGRRVRQSRERRAHAT